MRLRRVLAAGILALVVAACSSTGEPGHTAAIDVVPVDADGVRQTVTAVSDGFDRVTVTTATYGRAGVDGRLELSVTPAGAAAGTAPIRRAAATGDDIRDNAPLTFAFEPVETVAGDLFALTITYAGEEPVALYRSPYDPYAAGELDAGGDLVFTLGHGDRVGGAVGALARTSREATAMATGDAPFLAVWVAGLAALVVAGVRLGWRADGRGGPSR